MTERDWIHLGLSILGCIPVVGITANIANAVLYFQEGDALNGLLSVAGALIGVGGVTAAIGAAKGICALTTVGQAIKTAGVAYTAGASAMQTIEAASKTFNMLKENDFQWNEEILISAGQTALSLAGTIAGFKAVGSCINEAAALSASGLACFVAGTKVLTDKGFKNIEDIQPGDKVYSTSDKTGESGYKEVLQVFQKETEVVTHVFYEVEKEDGETRTEEIETTLNHLFWCEGEWKAAGTLKAGDLLTLADGSQVEVTEITYEDRHTTVYNMEVEDYHTYHVGEDGVWVHNTDGCGTAFSNEKSGSESAELVSYYPSNNGAVPGTEKSIYLMEGDIIDRYGGLKGKYFSPAGTPIEMRALPYDADISQYRQFIVVKPFEVESSTITPAFEKIGLGTQYRSSVSVEVLLKKGIIRQIRGGN